MSTYVQSVIRGAFESLGFIPQPDPSGKVDGTQKFTVPPIALRGLRGSTILVKSDGSVRVRKKKAS